MTAAELREARALLIALHKEADAYPAIKWRLRPLRAALACVEVLQAASAEPVAPAHAPGLLRHQRRRFAPTQVLGLPGCEATEWGRPEYALTLAATQLGPLP